MSAIISSSSGSYVALPVEEQQRLYDHFALVRSILQDQWASATRGQRQPRTPLCSRCESLPFHLRLPFEEHYDPLCSCRIPRDLETLEIAVIGVVEMIQYFKNKNLRIEFSEEDRARQILDTNRLLKINAEQRNDRNLGWILHNIEHVFSPIRRSHTLGALSLIAARSCIPIFGVMFLRKTNPTWATAIGVITLVAAGTLYFVKTSIIEGIHVPPSNVNYLLQLLPSQSPHVTAPPMSAVTGTLCSLNPDLDKKANATAMIPLSSSTPNSSLERPLKSTMADIKSMLRGIFK